MTIYKIIINDTSYTDYVIYEINQNKKIELDVNPINNKLFTNDSFIINKHNDITIIDSSIRTCKQIAGVLILKNNKTYGKKKNKFIYKCIPNDKSIPSFLIPYEIKHIGFSKIYYNLYITFTYNEWIDKHPSGIIKDIIGPVNILENFYEYQLCCKNLNISNLKFTKYTNDKLKVEQSSNNFIDKYLKDHPNIENRKDYEIFTIDPLNSVDFDDGFSIKYLNNSNYVLSIYISNVTIWLDILDLWSIFSDRISTIYLPNKKKSMLPTILSDDLCSLKQNEPRFAFVMDIFINDNIISNINYSNCIICVNKNYVYEENELINNNNYKILLNITTQLSLKYKYVDTINDSHDVVAYLMILMNHECSKKMLEYNNGIYRATTYKEHYLDSLSTNIKKNIKLYSNYSGQYITFDNNTRHAILELDSYLHITSPIRRIVDLLNMIQIQKNLNLLELSDKSNIFYKKYINNLDLINTTMKNINKVQNDSELLNLFLNNDQMKHKLFDGYILNKINKVNNLFQYEIYLPEIKLTSKINSLIEFDNYDKKIFKLYLFNDEDNLKKKIKLQLI